MRTKENQQQNHTDMMLAYLCIKDLDTLPEQVRVLDRFGLTSAQIATICGVAEGSVRNARMESGKTVSRRKSKAPKRENTNANQ